MSNQGAIGLIDSGVGGLTVLREALKQLPNKRLIYLGDTVRYSYGPRSAEQVVQFTWGMTDFLLKERIRMLVITCNTATAVALEEIKAALPIPVVGVILPGTRAAVEVTRSNKIGVVGMLGTVRSASCETAIKSKAPTIEVTSLDCPKFVLTVESNQYRSPVAKRIVAETLQALQLKGLDTLILGCTHYPLLRPVIQNVMGNHVTLIDPGTETVGEVSMLPNYFDIAHTPKVPTQPHEPYTTGSAKIFKEIASS